ncbi:barstar family protein [Streptomyces sp. NPDC017230]|uniref:barstar family protein n=1 Tax=unclassified Streptomyces TaxID=2593676 RepID=UPI0037B18155
MPEWFGRNLDAWSDTIETRGISEVIDSHDILIVHVDRRSLFGGDRQEGHVLVGIFDGEQNRLVVHGMA